MCKEGGDHVTLPSVDRLTGASLQFAGFAVGTSPKTGFLLIELEHSPELLELFLVDITSFPRDHEGHPLTGAEPHLCLLFCRLRYIENSLLSANKGASQGAILATLQTP